VGLFVPVGLWERFSFREGNGVGRMNGATINAALGANFSCAHRYRQWFSDEERSPPLVLENIFPKHPF